MAQRRLGQSSAQLNSSFQHLSSGLRINRASDDAAGLAVSALLSTDAKVYNQAGANADDAISLLSVGDGALQELSNIATRIKELSEQAANSTLTVTQRKPLHDEANALVSEYNRIVSSTQFNNIDLLSGSASSIQAQLGYGQSSQISFASGSKLATNVATGTYTETVHVGGSPTSGIATGDINGDGIEDFAASTSGLLCVYRLGNGDGTFKSQVSFPITAASNDVLLADFNGDGYDDIAAASTNGIEYALANSDGTFKASSNLSIVGGGDPNEVKAADFNNDGVLDLLLTEKVGGGNQYVNVLIGNANGTFKAGFAVGGLSNRPWVADFGDVNNDGALDIVVGSQTLTGLSVILNNGNGTFKTATNVAASNSSIDVALGDFNRDGKIDYVTTLSGVNTIYAFGNGDGTFGPQISLAIVGGQIQVTDFTGDGYSDIAIAAGTSLKLFTGNGDGYFTAPSTITTNADDVATADFNNDGAIDFALSTGAGSVGIEMAAPRSTTAIPYVYLFSKSGALETLDGIGEVLSRVNLERGANGAYGSRLAYASSVIKQTRENYTAAASQITDADVAEETANLVRAKILQQAGAAILAQANNVPKIALDLLAKT